ncbi:guanylate kinase-related [Anaeramoeba flamelloides]|uniref:guanylate kinase n=1 Tax=Anaeramoeba flamelloides TaxID=1746091 RepID=A0AAV7YSV1_9EUKA|nr:guanylate kinase-related [Anaeramoeba flamelloides]KAJ6246919.1 guanylate kinase-related [Anaeramoeba flamelloides]|eukprot:Anaeramoba_flamelloidesa809094_210.p1 GENE.a809094_210~~a809094_210.p1  ORF type:complete len:194 (+),score=41.70 a809094_210:26-607(+)
MTTEKKKPIVLNGPSGSGKSFLLRHLMKKYPGKFSFSISHTTRQPRKGEKHGVHYYYVSKEKFQELKDDNQFIEHATVHGNMYGTSIQAVRDVQSQGKIAVLDVNIDGALSISKTDLKPRLMFVKPPSWELLEKRLRGRNTETEEQIETRLNTAKKEMKWVEEHSDFYHHIIINDNVDNAIQQLSDILEEDLD